MATLVDLYDYDEWAMGRVFEAASGLDEEQLDVPLGNPDWTLRTGIAHIIGAQALWFARMRGERTDYDPRERRSLEQLREAYGREHGGFRALVAAMSAEDLAQTMMWGRTNPVERTWLEIVLQVAQHSIHHRGELSALLTTLGRSPGDLDYLFYLRDRDAVQAQA